MYKRKKLALLFWLLLHISISVNAQKPFKYAHLKRYDINLITPGFQAHGFWGRNFNNRLVLPEFLNDTLVTTLGQDTLFLTQELGSPTFLESSLYPKKTTIEVTTHQGKSYRLKRIKLIEIFDDHIQFLARFKEKRKKGRWIPITMMKSDLSGLYVGNTFLDIPLVITGTLAAVAAMAILDSLFDEDL